MRVRSTRNKPRPIPPWIITRQIRIIIATPPIIIIRRRIRIIAPPSIPRTHKRRSREIRTPIPIPIPESSPPRIRTRRRIRLIHTRTHRHRKTTPQQTHHRRSIHFHFLHGTTTSQCIFIFFPENSPPLPEHPGKPHSPDPALPPNPPKKNRISRTPIPAHFTIYVFAMY